MRRGRTRPSASLMGSGAQWALAMTARNSGPGRLIQRVDDGERTPRTRFGRRPASRRGRAIIVALAGPVIAARRVAWHLSRRLRGLATGEIIGVVSMLGAHRRARRFGLCDRTARVYSKSYGPGQNRATRARRRASRSTVDHTAETSRQKIGHDPRASPLRGDWASESRRRLCSVAVDLDDLADREVDLLPRVAAPRVAEQQARQLHVVRDDHRQRVAPVELRVLLRQQHAREPARAARQAAVVRGEEQAEELVEEPVDRCRRPRAAGARRRRRGAAAGGAGASTAAPNASSSRKTEHCVCTRGLRSIGNGAPASSSSMKSQQSMPVRRVFAANATTHASIFAWSTWT